MKEARLWHSLEDTTLRCVLCAHRCRIADNDFGICGVRQNQGGTLYSLVYGLLVAQAVDPIEKKPLYHFYPESTAYSVATVGCNFRCAFCQNADISQSPRDHGRIVGRHTEPEDVVRAAKQYGSRSIAYTYGEPTMFYEYSLDIGRLAHQEGIANVYVSNGYMTPEMLDEANPADEPGLIDAANIDLKSFRDVFYRQQCGARLQPVLDSLKTLKARNVWLEVTTLIIPGLNDSEEELGDIARFIVTELGPDTPWHVSRFHPTYRMMDRPSTPVDTVSRAREIGLEAGLHYVYIGNVPGSGAEDTICPHCGHVVIHRAGYTVVRYDADGGTCGRCGGHIAGVGL
ncbi:MAG TPA: AmmeMemoRadiSam system radical SAM enzyme [Chloroflexi bacterium]|jgi:pyruvate formate lyase activating enzyme|nr:AmmeMemoRadiSam system radical SAM enzyme [Chloroflexota bacterium]